MFFTYWPDLGDTPARVNRYTGEIQINQRYFDRMPELRRKFIIEHEKGHFNLDTRSEFEADKYAFRRIAGSAPRSLKESVKSISKVLTFRNPEHLDRMTEVIKMALDYDYKNNGNDKAKTALQELNQILQTNHLNNFHMYTSKDNSYFEPKFPDSGFEDIYDNAKGKAKRQAKKAARVAKRKEKKVVRVAKRKANMASGKFLPPQVLAIRGIKKAVQRSQSRGSWRPGDKRKPVNASVPASPYMENTSMEEEINFPLEQQEQIYPEESYPEENYPQEEYTEESSSYTEPVEVEEEFSEEDQPEEYFSGGECINPAYYDNAGGAAARRAKRQARKDKRNELKDAKKAAKVEVIKARAQAKLNRSGAKMELAKQGKSGTDWLGSAVSSIAGIFGGKKESASEMPIDDGSGYPLAEEPKKILGMPKGVAIAVIAVLVITIIGGVIYFVKRKK